MLAIGLMSGTSMDGIDVALLETDGEGQVRRLAAGGYPYDEPFRARLSRALDTARSIRRRDERPGDLAALDGEIARRHATAVRRFAEERRVDLGSVDIVGFHGQTVLHRPQDALTVQIGDGQALADALGVGVVHDVRAADMAAGGQGAPFVPAYHAALAHALPDGMRNGPVAFVNIGGISNVTCIDGNADPVAFDTGPGNALIDQWVSREAGIPFDRDGAIAGAGRLIDGMADAYLSAGFFAKPAPNSLDRLDFAVPPPGSGPLEDVARTLCRVAATAVLKAADHLPRAPTLWIVGGGGRKHPVIMADLRDGAARLGASVASAEEVGLDGDAIEAEAWAYLAVRSLRGLPLSWPGTTGCRTPVTGGVLTRPSAAASA
jgi:anhydro-N-acetylmuramic acid kinase